MAQSSPQFGQGRVESNGGDALKPSDVGAQNPSQARPTNASVAHEAADRGVHEADRALKRGEIGTEPLEGSAEHLAEAGISFERLDAARMVGEPMQMLWHGSPRVLAAARQAAISATGSADITMKEP